MSIFDLYSKRQKVLNGEVSDVYKYDDIPQHLRVQVVHIWTDALGAEDSFFNSNGDKTQVESTYKFMVDALCREYGFFNLPGADRSDRRYYVNELVNYFLNEQETERVIDVLELSFRVIDRLTRDFKYLNRREPDKYADAAISELNARFKEHGIGYRYSDGEIFRIDSELIHAEVVVPTLRLLNVQAYAGAQEEFIAAHKHYREGKYKEALNDCLKSLESTMKVICDLKSWDYPKNATSKKLIQICLENELVPIFWQQQLSSLRSMLESGVPTGRNKLSGHGQGSEQIDVPDQIVAYMLHTTASTILFFAMSEEATHA